MKIQKQILCIVTLTFFFTFCNIHNAGQMFPTSLANAEFIDELSFSYTDMNGKTPLIFKLDDFEISNPDSNFTEALDIFSRKHISASVGLILDSDNNLTTFKYLKNLNIFYFDFFFHGITHFINSTSAEFETNYYTQLEKTQLAKDIADNYGIDLQIFGAPGNRYNSETKIALRDAFFKGMFVKEKDLIFNDFVEMKIDFSDLETGFFDQGFNESYLYERWITPFKDSNIIVIQLHPIDWNNEQKEVLESFLDLIVNDIDIIPVRAIEYVQNLLTKGELDTNIYSDMHVISTSDLTDVYYYLFEESGNDQWEVIDNYTGISLFRFKPPEIIPLLPRNTYIIKKFDCSLEIETDIKHVTSNSIEIQWQCNVMVNEWFLLIFNEKELLIYNNKLCGDSNNTKVEFSDNIKLAQVALIAILDINYCIKFTNDWIFAFMQGSTENNETSTLQLSISKSTYRIVIIVQLALNIGCVTYILIKRRR